MNAVNVGKEDPIELDFLRRIQNTKLIHMGKEDPVELDFSRLSKRIQNIYTQGERVRFAEGLR